MEAKELRYIVFMLNTDTQQYMPGGERVDTHDGKILCKVEDAKEYAQDAINEKHCTRFAIGTFLMDMQKETMSISLVETFGFRNDKKNVYQLSLFN